MSDRSKRIRQAVNSAMVARQAETKNGAELLEIAGLRPDHFKGKIIKGIDLRGWDLRGLDLEDSVISECDYDSETKFPQGLHIGARKCIDEVRNENDEPVEANFKHGLRFKSIGRRAEFIESENFIAVVPGELVEPVAATWGFHFEYCGERLACFVPQTSTGEEGVSNLRISNEDLFSHFSILVCRHEGYKFGLMAYEIGNQGYVECLSISNSHSDPAPGVQTHKVIETHEERLVLVDVSAIHDYISTVDELPCPADKGSDLVFWNQFGERLSIRGHGELVGIRVPYLEDGSWVHRAYVRKFMEGGTSYGFVTSDGDLFDQEAYDKWRHGEIWLMKHPTDVIVAMNFARNSGKVIDTSKDQARSYVAISKHRSPLVFDIPLQRWKWWVEQLSVDVEVGVGGSLPSDEYAGRKISSLQKRNWWFVQEALYDSLEGAELVGFSTVVGGLEGDKKNATLLNFVARLAFAFALSPDGGCGTIIEDWRLLAGRLWVGSVVTKLLSGGGLLVTFCVKGKESDADGYQLMSRAIVAWEAFVFELYSASSKTPLCPTPNRENLGHFRLEHFLGQRELIISYHLRDGEKAVKKCMFRGVDLDGTLRVVGIKGDLDWEIAPEIDLLNIESIELGEFID